MIRLFCLIFLFYTSVFAQDSTSLNSESNSGNSESVILVLDVSGSMWGVIEEKSKIEIARNVVSDLLKTWPVDRELGLVAYGHRTKGDCSDIETIIPVGNLNPKVFNEKVRAFSPKGKTPMVAAIRHAAEALKYKEENATVILVSDGEETCEADPCAIAKELEKMGVNFTAHVIGFDLKNAAKEAEQQMKCIAEATGGKFLTANNAFELSSALKQAVVVAVPEKPEEKIVHAIQESKENIVAIAYETEGGNLIKKGLAWQTHALDQTGQKVENLGVIYDAEYKKILMPGKYLLEASYGDTTESKVIEVKEEYQEIKFFIGTGILKLTPFVGEKEKISKVSWEITAIDNEFKKTVYPDEPEVILKSGKYKVKLNWGESSVTSSEIEVVAGKTTEATIRIEAGRLTPKAYAAEGGEQLKKQLAWKVEKKVSSLEQSYENAGHSYSAEPEFRLLAGDYRLTAEWGEAKAIKEVSVVAGQTLKVDLVLNAGILKLLMTSSDGGKVSKTETHIYKKEKTLTNERQTLAHSYSDSPEFFLSAGEYEYEVETKAGGTLKGEVKITAGQRSEVNLNIE